MDDLLNHRPELDSSDQDNTIGRGFHERRIMRITWYGHAAFLIEAEGKRIILDPYRWPDAGGYEPIDEPTDIVVVSHENDRYHSHLGQIVPPFDVLRALEFPAEGTESHGIRIQAVPVFESPEKLPGDEVTIIHFVADGLRLVFLGDLGHSLSDAELAPIRGADVVLVPAGGPPTIDFPEIPSLLDAINPRVVIPMHFKTPKINLDIQPVERFLEALPELPVRRAGACSIELDRAGLPDRPTIVLLDHLR